MTMPGMSAALRSIERCPLFSRSFRFALHLLDEHRFLRFLIVGGLNTAVGYGLFLLALAIMPTTLTALCTSTVFAILFNFVTTGSYVFKSRDPRLLIRFFGVYGIVLLYNAIGLHLLEGVMIGPRIGAILLLPGAVVMAYLLNRQFVFTQTASSGRS